jgi:hypothetical protein
VVDDVDSDVLGQQADLPLVPAALAARRGGVLAEVREHNQQWPLPKRQIRRHSGQRPYAESAS